MGDKDEKFADDLLVGAVIVGGFLFGEDDPNAGRKIYGMDETTKSALGLFRMGKKICGRRSTIRRRIAEREAGAQDG